jgi:hypothetical protein
MNSATFKMATVPASDLKRALPLIIEHADYGIFVAVKKQKLELRAWGRQDFYSEHLRARTQGRAGNVFIPIDAARELLDALSNDESVEVTITINGSDTEILIGSENLNTGDLQ